MCQFDKGWTWLCFSISIRSFHFPTRESVPFERPVCFDNRLIESIYRLYSVCVLATFLSRCVIAVGFFGYVSRGKRREKWTSIRTTGTREWPTRAIRNDIRGVDGNRRHQDKSANHERTVSGSPTNVERCDRREIVPRFVQCRRLVKNFAVSPLIYEPRVREWSPLFDDIANCEYSRESWLFECSAPL